MIALRSLCKQMHAHFRLTLPAALSIALSERIGGRRLCFTNSMLHNSVSTYNLPKHFLQVLMDALMLTAY